MKRGWLNKDTPAFKNTTLSRLCNVYCQSIRADQPCLSWQRSGFPAGITQGQARSYKCDNIRFCSHISKMLYIPGEHLWHLCHWVSINIPFIKVSIAWQKESVDLQHDASCKPIISFKPLENRQSNRVLCFLENLTDVNTFGPRNIFHTHTHHKEQNALKKNLLCRTFIKNIL